jgi:hypothetical protein
MGHNAMRPCGSFWQPIPTYQIKTHLHLGTPATPANVTLVHIALRTIGNDT